MSYIFFLRGGEGGGRKNVPFSGKRILFFLCFLRLQKVSPAERNGEESGNAMGKCREYRWEKFEAVKGSVSVSVLFVLHTVVKLNSNRILRRTADDARYLLQRMPFFLATLSGWILLHR